MPNKEADIAAKKKELLDAANYVSRTWILPISGIQAIASALAVLLRHEAGKL